MDRKHWHLLHTELPLHHGSSSWELKLKGGFLIPALSMQALQRTFIAAKKGGKKVWVSNHKQKRNQGSVWKVKERMCLISHAGDQLLLWESAWNPVPPPPILCVMLRRQFLQVLPNCYNWTLQTQRPDSPKCWADILFRMFSFAVLVVWKIWVIDIWDLAKLLQT